MWVVPTTQSERTPAATYPRVAGVSTLASMSKCLAQMSKTSDHRRRYHKRFGP